MRSPLCWATAAALAVAVCTALAARPAVPAAAGQERL